MIKFLAVCRFSTLRHMITMSGYPEMAWRVWVQVGYGPASRPDYRPAGLPVLWDLVAQASYPPRLIRKFRIRIPLVIYGRSPLVRHRLRLPLFNGHCT